MTKLSIIIINFNTKQLVKDCIFSLAKQYEKELHKGLFEVIVADNGSTDGSFNDFQKTYKEKKYITVLDNQKNLGFGKGNNQAVKKAKGEYVFFLNSDTELLDHGLAGMVEFLDSHNTVGILGGRLVDDEKKEQKSAGDFYTLSNLLVMLLGGERFGFLRYVPDCTCPVGWVSGASMMVRKKVFEELGGFDEKIFMYMEDMELCFRASQKNIKTFFYPTITILHHEHGSSNREFAIVHIYEGILYFYQKYKPSWQVEIARLLLKSKALVLIMLGRLSHNASLSQTYEKALSVS